MKNVKIFFFFVPKLGILPSVMVSKLKWQTTISEFESHWVYYTSSCVSHL